MFFDKHKKRTLSTILPAVALALAWVGLNASALAQEGKTVKDTSPPVVVAGLAAAFNSTAITAGAAGGETQAGIVPRLTAGIGNLPLAFETNRGQSVFK